jgi:hypothetical protein
MLKLFMGLKLELLDFYKKNSLRVVFFSNVWSQILGKFIIISFPLEFARFFPKFRKKITKLRKFATNFFLKCYLKGGGFNPIFLSQIFSKLLFFNFRKKLYIYIYGYIIRKNNIKIMLWYLCQINVWLILLKKDGLEN